MRARVKPENTRKTLKTTLQSKMDMTNRIQKFVDCRSKDISEREVFIVEGDLCIGCLQAGPGRPVPGGDPCARQDPQLLKVRV